MAFDANAWNQAWSKDEKPKTAFDAGAWNGAWSQDEKARAAATGQKIPFDAQAWDQAWSQPTPLPAPAPDQNIEQPGYGEELSRYLAPQFLNTPDQDFFRTHGDEFLKPTADQDLYTQTQARGGLKNNSQHEYDTFQRPDIAKEPGYDSYYDNASRKLDNTMNTQMGARGAYGSSVGVGQLGAAQADLRADEARTNADYNLKRLAEQRQWGELGGSLARNADLTGQGNADTMSTLAQHASTDQQTGIKNMGAAAHDASTSKLTGLAGAVTAALGNQTARENRIGLGADTQKGLAAMMQQMFGDSWKELLTGDQSLLESSENATVGKTREDLNAEQQKLAEETANRDSITKFIASLYT